MTTWCATGHRPPKLGGYGEDVFDALVELAYEVLPLLKVDKMISGMALGWDQAVAQACIDLNIPFIAATPCRHQDSKWPDSSRQKWISLMDEAESIHNISEQYTPSCMQERNRWMVDNSEAVLALYDGSRGGTENCIMYAKSQDSSIHNVWKKWKDMK